MPPLKTNWIVRLMTLLTLTTLACQLGSDVEVIPTPVVVRDVEPVERPSAREETQLADPAPTAAPVVTEAEPAARTIQDLQNATVQIFARTDGQILWTGSGTIISPDGLILTNAHVASPTSSGLAAFYNDPEFLYTEQPEELVVALVEAADRPPVESYLAEVRAADGALDLAVIQIVATVAGTALAPADLDLPYLVMGDSDTVQLGDEVRVLGFPGAGGDTITFTRGDVSGFESQEPIGFRAWIKTDTTVSPGNSGGLGANAVGEVIGVPSFVIEAMGGAINRLRSINLAQPLVEAARSGETYISPYVVAGTGEEAFTLVTWALDFYEDTSCPIDPVTRYGSGSVAAIAIFEYAGMRDGEQVILDWFIGDDLLFTHIITWEYGESGDCFVAWVHNYGDPIEDGTYTVELYAGDAVDFIASADVVVGGASSTASTTTTATAGTVQVEGRITDADTGRPISDATLFILYPDVDLDAWLDNPTEEDIFTYAEVNPRGEYELPDLLQRGISYPGVAAAEGYRSTDGYLTIEEDDPNLLILDLELTK